MAADSSTKRCLSFCPFLGKYLSCDVIFRFRILRKFPAHFVWLKISHLFRQKAETIASGKRAANVTNPSASQLLAWTMEEKKAGVRFYICGIFRPLEGRNFSFSYKRFHEDLREYSGRYLVS